LLITSSTTAPTRIKAGTKTIAVNELDDASRKLKKLARVSGNGRKLWDRAKLIPRYTATPTSSNPVSRPRRASSHAFGSGTTVGSNDPVRHFCRAPDRW
jgi:hypothetical protein